MAEKAFIISKKTIVKASDFRNPVLKNASMILQRDIEKVTTKDVDENRIELILDPQATVEGDAYRIAFVSADIVKLTAKTALGVMYGALAISREILGVDDFWYWMDKLPVTKDTIKWTNFDLHLPEFQTKYRGWFVNDELLIMGWEDHDSQRYVWQRIFETALRVGCNLIVPGTDINSQINRQPAKEFGLMIAHHHAEPLGAKMFAREYPTLTASFIKYPDLFRKLWRDAIMEQKGTPTIYSLGFRGQGDKPFWLDDDSRKWDDHAIADVINGIIKEQYNMVKELDPGAPMALNVYGELTGLYNKGLIKVPNDIIEIWADSGYGKMVSRRQGLDNPRSPILEAANPEHRQRGIYYHVAFHDLQASNFLGLLSNSPAFVSSELMKVRQHHFDTLELINTGSIKPHILYLREVAKSWLTDYSARNNETILKDYVTHYYAKKRDEVVQLYDQYWQAIVQYGPHTDETAGDEFAPYLIRRLIKAWVSGQDKLSDAGWVVGDAKLDKSLEKLDQLITPKLADWDTLLLQVQELLLTLDQEDSRRLYGDLYLSVINQARGLKALHLVIEAYQEVSKAKKSDDYVKPFLVTDEAYRYLNEITIAEKTNPSTKWRDFYKNDGYNNVPLAVSQLKFLRHYLRTLGDSDDEDKWEHHFIKATAEARVMTLSNTRPAMSDDKLAEKLRERLIDHL